MKCPPVRCWELLEKLLVPWAASCGWIWRLWGCETDRHDFSKELRVIIDDCCYIIISQISNFSIDFGVAMVLILLYMRKSYGY
jgi:hypothetical protein